MIKRQRPTLQIKRVYLAPSLSDGRRVLVDRLWPRGLTKDAARIDFWAKALAPSDALRKRFHADPGFPDDNDSWAGFERAFVSEIVAATATPEGAAAMDTIRSAMAEGVVTLVFGLKNEVRNNAAVLRDFLSAG